MRTIYIPYPLLELIANSDYKGCVFFGQRINTETILEFDLYEKYYWRTERPKGKVWSELEDFYEAVKSTIKMGHTGRKTL